MRLPAAEEDAPAGGDCEDLTRGMERQARDDKVELENAHTLLRAQVPDANRLIEGSRCEHVAVPRMEFDGPRRAPVAPERAAQ